MGYYINLEAISIDDYRASLKSADLLPSRMVLKEDIDANFDALVELGITSCEDLRKALSNKQKLRAVAEQTGIPEPYLKVSIREVRSYRQKPNRIQDFPGIPGRVSRRLAELGIMNTRQLFDQVLTPSSRRTLSQRLGLSQGDILRLTRLTDLSRIRWVNHTFAYVLLEAGYNWAEDVAQADHNVLYQQVRSLNEERGIYKGHIGLHDMKRCVEAAGDVSPDIKQ